MASQSNTVDTSALVSVLQNNVSCSSTEQLQQLSGLDMQPGIAVDFFVSPKLKEQIWSDQFIEFHTLLPSYKHESNLQFKDLEGTLYLAPAKQSRHLSLNDWVSAFTTYMSVYVAKYPDQNITMLKYLQIVRGIGLKGGDFRRYDETFRRLRQVSRIPWNVVHTELYMQVMMNNTNAPRQNQSFHPSGFQSSRKVPKVLLQVPHWPDMSWL